MPGVVQTRSEFFRQMGPNFIDGIALLAALLWCGLTVLWGLSTGIPPVTAIERGLVVSIVVYSIVYVGTYIVIWAAFMAKRKRKAEARRRRIEARDQQSREQQPESSQKQ
jgi:hypothetical protein